MGISTQVNSVVLVEMDEDVAFSKQIKSTADAYQIE